VSQDGSSPGLAIASAAPASAPGLRELAGLLGEIGDLKRVHAAHLEDSVAGGRFASAWAALVGGADVREVALRETAAAVTGARLGAIDARVLATAGVSPAVGDEVLERAFDAVSGFIAEPLRAELRAVLGDRPAVTGDGVPRWVAALGRQPRAGATRPGRPRLMLQPEESHAEHCWTVAVGAVLAAPLQDSQIEAPFLCGLAHHLHNAVLPDAGFAGEALLGSELEPLLARLTDEALSELSGPLEWQTRGALGLCVSAESAPSRAFHAADVLDRVLEMDHHARTAAFTVEHALEELELVHEGPTQAFGFAVLEAAGLR